MQQKQQSKDQKYQDSTNDSKAKCAWQTDIIYEPRSLGIWRRDEHINHIAWEKGDYAVVQIH